MARARGDHPEGEREPEVRQQKLPMFRRVAPLVAAPAPVPATVSPDPAAPATAEPPARPAPAEAPAPPPVRTRDAEPPSATGAVDAVVAAGGVPAAPPVHGVSLRPATAPSASEPAPTPTLAAAGGVGDLLLSARADSGFSIEEASSRTRIPRDVIEHLECSACGQLPPEYYCNAHIEKLSALYNVDARPILDRFHEDMVAQRGGAAEGLGHFHAVTTDSESGSKISYVLPGPGTGKPARAVSLTGAVVSGVLALLLLVVVVALATQHFRHRGAATPAGAAVLPEVGHVPPVELKEFIVTEELNAYELPIPAK